MVDESALRPEQVAVIGAGRMGRGIALACILADTPVALVDLKERSFSELQRLRREAFAEIERDLRFLASLQLLPEARVDPLLTNIRIVQGVEAIQAASQADLIFEGLPETEEAKRLALEWASAHSARDAIIASTTSTMDINRLSQWVSEPQRFLNAHWLNPAHLMPLVEMAVGAATSDATVKRLRGMLKGLGKIPVVCSASPGYIVPRIQALAMNEAARLVQEGVASAEDIDTAVRVGFGLRFAVLGLLEFIDWGGNDILYYASGHLSRTVDANRYTAPEIIEKNMREGRNGVREGQGFYDYRQQDVDAYRRQRLEQFVGLIKHLGLLPAGLKTPGKRS